MRILVLYACILLQSVNSELYTTYVNFEKYYFIEEELISLVDLIIQQEKIIHGDDAHDLLNISHIIEDGKAIHRDFANDIKPFLLHPINTFHLSKRLAKTWKKITEQIIETDTCVKTLRVKLQNMDDNIPTKAQFDQIAISMLKLEKVFNLTVSDLMQGEINETLPQQPLTFGDVVDIARTAYDNEQFYYAITWLSYVANQMEERSMEKTDGEHTREQILSTLASAYFKMNLVGKAIETTETLLSLDPTNKNAKRNLEYYKTIDSKNDPKELTVPIPPTKSLRLYDKICSKQIEEIPSRKKCLYFPLRSKMWYDKSDIKAEVIKSKPLIIYFHEFIDNKTVKALRYMGHEKLLQLTSEVQYRYPRQSSSIDDRTNWRWVPKLEKKLNSLHISNLKPRNSKFNVMNVGLDGLISKKMTRSVPPVGSFIVGLTDDAVGGELAFPLTNVKIKLGKGDVLFYEDSTLFTICPVAYGEVWYGFQYLFEVPYPKNICPPKRRARRGY